MISFKIKDEHIKHGNPSDDYNNPLGLALQSIFPRDALISVGSFRVQINDKILDMSPDLINWLTDYEMGSLVKELDVELDFVF